MVASIGYKVGMFLVALCITNSSFAEDMKVAADPWCPFTCSSSSAKPGVLIEILREAMGSKVSIKYEEVAWARAVNEARIGKYAAIVGALKADAPDFVFPSIPVAEQKSCFYVTPDSKWKFKDVSSLSGSVLGAVSEYTYGEPADGYIKAAGKESKKLDLITGTDTAERLLRKLKDRRIDVMIEDDSVVSYLLSQHPDLKQFAPKRVFCQKPQPLFVAFSPATQKESKIYAAKLVDGLKKMKATKQMQKIFSSYGLNP